MNEITRNYLLLCGFIFVLFVVIYSQISVNSVNQAPVFTNISVKITHIEKTNLVDVLQEVERNCGSTFFTKRDGNWVIFGEQCIEGGYCKYADIPLENCLGDD